MITATAFDLDVLIKEGIRLSHNKQKKSGRAMRRYLDRVLVSGFLLQHFALNQHYTDEQLVAIVKYAQKRGDELQALQASDVRDAAKAGSYVDIFVDVEAGVVANRYRLAYVVNEATVKQLRDMVSYVVEVCHNLHPFAKDPNAEALLDCPDYVYRGLPCSCSTAPWMVSGVDTAGGSGALEWCVDQADAEERFALMSKHSKRFRHLKAESWASLQAA
jgi:hypothetical protein